MLPRQHGGLHLGTGPSFFTHPRQPSTISRPDDPARYLLGGDLLSRKISPDGTACGLRRRFGSPTPPATPSGRPCRPRTTRPPRQRWTEAAVRASEEIIGNYHQSIVYQDSFTPVTIERFTRKAEGAVYGSADQNQGRADPWPNLFIAGTDQGYLGIVGAMLSGVTVVNQHLLQ